MRIPSGVTGQYIYFVAVDATDFATRETGLTTFTVYRSRNGAAAAAYTTPTVTEVDSTNMPGLYKLLVDEDMTIGAGNDSEEVALHVTHAGMAPVTRTIELYRPKITVGETLDVTSGAVDDVTLVATTTTNTDMRGTDSAATAANLAALNDIAATDIVSNGAITTLSGAVVNVDLVDTVTTNSDMRGTDSAATAANLAIVDGIVDNILTDTGTDIPAALTANLDAIGSISATSAAISTQASSYTLTTGVQSSGTVSNTENLDAVAHEHTDTAGTLDLYYEFSVGGNATGVACNYDALVTGSNDVVDVFAYNWGGASWDQVGSIQGTNSSTVYLSDSVSLLTRHTGAGSDIGLVRLRFQSASLSSATLKVDRISCAYSVVSDSVGYANGAVWIDTTSGVAGTEAFVNGVADNPVDSLADALTIASSVLLRKFEVGNGSTVTLASSTENKVFSGHEWALALGGQSVASTMVIDANVTGTGTGSDSEYDGCLFGIASLAPFQAYDCSFTATTSGGMTLSAAGNYRFISCQSGVPGSSSPLFTLGTGAILAEWRRWSGGITVSGISSDDVLTISGELGTVTLNGADGQVEIRGTYKAIVDNRTGSPTLNTDGAIHGADVSAILVDTSTTIPGTIATIDSNVDAILVDTNELQTDDIPTTLASLATASALATVDANVDAVLVDTGTTIPAAITGLNDLSAADVNAEVDTALADIHLDHLLAVDYDPASKPGTATALLNELVESDAGVSRFTINSLENAPSGSGASAGAIADAVWTEAIADHSGTVGSTAEALDGITAGSGLTAAETRAALGLASANLDTQLSAIDTVVDAVLVDTGTSIPADIAALNDIAATDIVSGGAINTTAGAVDSVTLVATTTTNTDMRGTDSAATASALATVDGIVDAILVDTNELQADNIPGTLATIAGYVDTEITALISAVNTIDGIVDNILVDTNELQTDLADGGRLDLILDAILSDTGTDGVVLTTAERNAVADAILDRDMSTGTDSGSPTVRTMRQALRFNRNKVTIAGGTLTVTKEDDVTTSHTATVTTAAGDPITTVDPA